MSGLPFLLGFNPEISNKPHTEPTDLRYFLSEKLNLSCEDKNRKTNKLVLMLTRAYDLEADLICIKLLEKGIEYARINIEDIPEKLKIRYSVGPKSDPLIEFKIRNQKFRVSDVNIVLFRHFELDLAQLGSNELTSVFCHREWHDAYDIMRTNLKCTWINDYSYTLSADNPLKQLLAAKKIGLNIPETLITNDPTEACRFYQNLNQDIIIKSLRHHHLETTNKVYSIFTHAVKKQDIQRICDLKYAPTILQKRLHRKTELRVTVVGNKAFAVEINPQSRESDIHSTPLNQLQIKPAVLDAIISKKCISLVNAMGLKCGAIDLVKDESDGIFFLELNSVGDWQWVGEPSSLAITEALIDLIQNSM